MTQNIIGPAQGGRRWSRSLAVAAMGLMLSACSHLSMPKMPSMPSMPKLSLPKLGSDKPAEAKQDLSATPRDLLSAKLVNPRADSKTPNMTVGKLLEFADRYLACDCANMRFARAWEKTDDGYQLLANSGVVRPLHFICKDGTDGRECFLAEIDRGPQTDTLHERFVPGSEFIQFIYQNGVKCERETPCQ